MQKREAYMTINLGPISGLITNIQIDYSDNTFLTLSRAMNQII